jgi:hypothetical protein
MIKYLVLLLSVFGFVAAAQPSSEPATAGDSMDHTSPNREPAKKKTAKKKSKKKKAKKHSH